MGPQGANIAHIVQQGVFLIGVTILFRRASRALSVTPPRVVDPAPGE
jgi:hypothetical protein